MKLYGYTCSYNCAYLIPYVMPYVERLGYDKFVVYDNMSNDNTVELLSKYPFVEVRKYDTNGIFDEVARNNLHVDSINDCYNIYEETGEDIWTTWTDFDEVIWPNIMIDFKCYLNTMKEVWGYNYFSAKMVDLFFKDGQKREPFVNNEHTLIHTVDDIMCHWWNREGVKPTLLLINSIDKCRIVHGNHCMYVTPKKGVEMINLNETGTLHAFHLKYIDLKSVIDSEKKRKDRRMPSTDEENVELAFKNYLSASFPISDYFLHSAFESSKNGIHHHEGLICL